jgi:hypothetical protein
MLRSLVDGLTSTLSTTFICSGSGASKVAKTCTVLVGVVVMKTQFCVAVKRYPHAYRNYQSGGLLFLAMFMRRFGV